MSNYGWVPRPIDDPDRYLDRLALLVSRRPSMEMIEISSTLQGFGEEASLRAAPPPPIDAELVVGGHAGRLGYWEIDPFPNSPGPWTDFEALETSLRVPSLALTIPDALIGYSPATPQTTARAFHVKGCNIGQALPWLVKLREALGGHVRVSAPKHFHGVSFNGTPDATPLEGIEWMGYQFVVFRKHAFSNRDALATAFHAQGHLRPNGAPIPRAAYKGWIKSLGVTNLSHVVSPKNQDTRALEIRAVRARESPITRRVGGARRAGRHAAQRVSVHASGTSHAASSTTRTMGDFQFLEVSTCRRGTLQ